MVSYRCGRYGSRKAISTSDLPKPNTPVVSPFGSCHTNSHNMMTRCARYSVVGPEAKTFSLRIDGMLLRTSVLAYWPQSRLPGLLPVMRFLRDSM